MRIDIITIFPQMIEAYINESIIKRAYQDEKVEINVINLRNYSQMKHHQVDDTPYGGGSGMLMMFPPFYRAIKDLNKDNQATIIMTSPKGKTYNQKIAREYSKLNHIIILCGHYEGIDHRVYEFVDEEVSVGDYILTGGELAALILTDSITRLLDGVITEDSHLEESFEKGLLEHPHYTKPQEYEGYQVPDVLLSGHHENIRKWRHEMALKETFKKRPDLLESYPLTKSDKQLIESLKEDTND